MPPAANFQISNAAGEIPQAGRKDPEFVVGAFLFIALTIFFFIELILTLTSQRPFHRFWIVCILASALIGCCATRKFSPAVGEKIRRGLFVLIVVAAALFIQYSHLPITVVSMTLRSVAGPTDFSLWQFLPDRKERSRTTCTAPSRHAVSIDFRLPAAMRGHRRALKIYFGRAPKSYDILKISFGTQVLGLPVPLASFHGASLLQVAGTPKTANRFELVDGAARLASRGYIRPLLKIVSDESFIRRNMPGSRTFLVKLLWFLLCTGISALVIWYHKITWVKVPHARTVMRYLIQ